MHNEHSVYNPTTAMSLNYRIAGTLCGSKGHSVDNEHSVIAMSMNYGTAGTLCGSKGHSVDNEHSVIAMSMNYGTAGTLCGSKVSQSSLVLLLTYMVYSCQFSKYTIWQCTHNYYYVHTHNVCEEHVSY